MSIEDELGAAAPSTPGVPSTPVNRPTTAHALVSALEAYGVETAFGIPGTHNLEIYRALTSSTIRHVLVRHEQGAAYAADAYARSSGKPGVVVTTSGPGLTNALTGMVNAYADSVPMLVVSPGVALGQERRGTGSLHEAKDLRGAVAHLVEDSIRPANADQIIDAIHNCFGHWQSHRRRPFHIEIPIDVLESDWTPHRVEEPAQHHGLGIDRDGVQLLRQNVNEADRPLLLVGGGTVDASPAVREFVYAGCVPVLTTFTAKGVVDENHQLSIGAGGGWSLADGVLQASDSVLAVGTELRGFPRTTFQGHLTRLDLEPAQLHNNAPSQLPIHGDADSTLSAATHGLRRRDRTDWVNKARGLLDASMHSYAVTWKAWCDDLAAALPKNLIVCGDSSQVSYRGVGLFWKFSEPRRHLFPDGYATLGYAIPAAVGAKVANPDHAVLAVIGDGAALFSIQELSCAAELNLPITVIVIENGGFAEIKENMQDRDMSPVGVDIPPPDFCELARALGCTATETRLSHTDWHEAFLDRRDDRPHIVVVRHDK